MMNPKPFQKRIAIVLLAIFLPSLMPFNLLYASNTGPVAPEAASFEPLDATDMVNLVTGQYSYVLPLLNVPSPEGGYPVALSYHAGIAMDQQSSWVGLGWNLNAGAINRNVSGYPDDYRNSMLSEFYYDAGGTETIYNMSLGYSNGAYSVGTNFSWGSNQAFGGSVSFGVGAKIEGVGQLGVSGSIGSNGASLGVGLNVSGLSLGISTSSNGEISGAIGYGNTNGEGFKVSSTGDFSISGGSVNIKNSSSGISFSMQNKTGESSVGAGANFSFSNSGSIGDYNFSQNGWSAMLAVPTQIGVFSMSFGVQKFKYWLNKHTSNNVIGPLYFNDEKYVVTWYDPNSLNPNNTRPRYLIHGTEYFNSLEDAQFFANELIQSSPDFVVDYGSWDRYSSLEDSFFDINEFVASGNFENELDIETINPSLPNYDNFNVQSQGIAGNFNLKFNENAALIGLSNKTNSNNYSLNYYNLTGNINDLRSDFIKFNTKPYFYFKNEISTYINVNEAIHNLNGNNSNIIEHFTNNFLNEYDRVKKSTYIEYFTNKEIINQYSLTKSKGFLNSLSSGFDRNLLPKDGIGAFKITAVDGKTYHYSLPVYNHEILTRTFGIVEARNNENQSYFEKRQFEPYATHWLLTAVTGPDYIDVNNDGLVGEEDFGYWVSLEYGNWSDAFAWKAPYKKDYFVDGNTKSYIRGRKQIYYLDKIKTRTHSALFVKSLKQDSNSQHWDYKSVVQNGRQYGDLGNYETRFTIPNQNQMRLKQIILLKNQDANILNKQTVINNQSVLVHYNKNYPTCSSGVRGCSFDFTKDKKENANFNNYENIIDENDNINECLQKSLKVINFNYDYSLVKGDSRLTLKAVEFNGKQNAKILPNYKFEYNNNSSNFNINDIDQWGYNSIDPSLWSLKQITTPTGAKLKINYEPHRFKSIVNSKIYFDRDSNENVFYDEFINSDNKLEFKAKANNNFGITVGSVFDVQYRKTFNSGYSALYLHTQKATVIEVLGNNEYKLRSWGPLHTYNGNYSSVNKLKGTFSLNTYRWEINNNNYYLEHSSVIEAGGIRVSSIKMEDSNTSHINEYKYGENENGIGSVSFLPNLPEKSVDLSYSSELASPRPMYEYVSVCTKNNNNENLEKIVYKFNVLKPINNYVRDGDVIIGDFYEIRKNINYVDNTSSVARGHARVGKFNVLDNWSSLGQLIEIKKYNKYNNLVNKVTNDYYKPSEVIPNNMGIEINSYQTYKKLGNEQGDVMWMVGSTSKKTYSSILKSTTTQSNGYTFTTEFQDYDLISGISKEQIHTSSDGKTFKTKVVPAYTKYPQMGSKVDDINNRNMLSQTAASYSYIQDAGDWKVTGVGITTWNNEWVYQDVGGNISSPIVDKEKIWRKQKSFVWNGVKDNNGIFLNYNDTNDDGFDWTVGVGSQPAQWKKTSEITLYDHYSMPIEVKDINNNKAATKMDVLNQKVEANGNAAYNEMYFSGAEILSGGGYLSMVGQEVQIVNGSRTDVKAHTGKYSIATTNNSQFGVNFKNGHRPGKYKISVWAHKDNYLKARLRWFNNDAVNTFDFNGEKVFAGDWVLLNHYTDVHFMNNANAYWYVNSDDNSTVYFDDLMIRPISSSITGYVYNEYDELTHIIGNNGLATRFEYDAAGRLVKTYVEIVDDPANSVIGGFKLKSENKYHYKNL